MCIYRVQCVSMVYANVYVHTLHMYATSRNQRRMLVTCSISLYVIPWESFIEPGGSPSNLLGLLQSARVIGTHGYFRFLLVLGSELGFSCLSSKSCYPLSHLSSPSTSIFSLLIYFVCVVVEVRAQLWESSPSTMWILGTGLSSSGLTARDFSAEPSRQPLNQHF